MGWIYLIIAGVLEIAFTTLLKKLSDSIKENPGFDLNKVWIVFGFLILAGLSFYLLMKAIETIPIGTAYAIWTGIGAFGTAIVGMIFFNDPVTTWRLVFIFLIVAAVVGLKVVSVA